MISKYLHSTVWLWQNIIFIDIDATTKMQLQNDNLDEQNIPTPTEPSNSAVYNTLEDEKQMTTEETTIKIQGKWIYVDVILLISLTYDMDIALFSLNCKFSFHLKRVWMEVVRIQ